MSFSLWFFLFFYFFCKLTIKLTFKAITRFSPIKVCQKCKKQEIPSFTLNEFYPRRKEKENILFY